MKENRKRLLKRIVSFALAVVMMASAFAVSVPDEVQAATNKTLTLKNAKGSVKISDKEVNAAVSGNEIVATGDVIWIKYKATADGYLKVWASDNTKASYSLGEWQFCNKSKKALTPITIYSTNQTDKYYYTDYFGVKKGTVYNLGVLACSGVKINAQLVSCKDKSGTKKAKALSLTQKKSVKGVVTAGTKTSHWYKFKTTKSQKLNITVSPWMTGNVTITVSGPGVYTSSFTVDMNKYWGKGYVITTNNKVKAGTYYIEIKPSTTKSTGYYSVKWK